MIGEGRGEILKKKKGERKDGKKGPRQESQNAFKLRKRKEPRRIIDPEEEARLPKRRTSSLQRGGRGVSCRKVAISQNPTKARGGQ